MSEETRNSKPQALFDGSSTQPLKPVKKAPRWRSIVLSVLGIIVLLVLGSLGGYWSGIGERKAAEASVRTQQLTEQYQYALVDEQFGRYDAARLRLEYIIQNEPNFPGAQNELAKVLVQSSIPTAVPTATVTPTPDTRGEESMFATAQQLVSTGDWANAIVQLDQLRKQDPAYKTAEIDGMYYFALRNYGVAMIQSGNLEGGIYELTLAEHFAPLDNTATGLREGARDYIQAASFFGVDWHASVQYFSQVAAGFPQLWDGTMTANQRYHEALQRYGDQLWKGGDACGAYTQYQAAMGIAALDATAAKNANQAYAECYPPTAAPTIASTEAPTGAAPSDTPPAPTATSTP